MWKKISIAYHHFSFRYVNWVRRKRKKKQVRQTIKKNKNNSKSNQSKICKQKKPYTIEIDPCAAILLYGFWFVFSRKDSIPIFDDHDRKKNNKRRKQQRKDGIDTFVSGPSRCSFFFLNTRQMYWPFFSDLLPIRTNLALMFFVVCVWLLGILFVCIEHFFG